MYTIVFLPYGGDAETVMYAETLGEVVEKIEQYGPHYRELKVVRTGE